MRKKSKKDTSPQYGSCPSCDKLILVFQKKDQELPFWGRMECPHCAEDIWIRFSTLFSVLYTQEEFDARYLFSQEEGITRRETQENMFKIKEEHAAAT